MSPLCKKVIFSISIVLISLVYFSKHYRESASSKWLRGSKDGYANGYNSICDFKTPELIDQAPNNKNYAKGYRDGYWAGVIECQTATWK